jgi:hypothetical protein
MDTTIRSSFELAYLHARLLAKLPLSPLDENMLRELDEALRDHKPNSRRRYRRWPADRPATIAMNLVRVACRLEDISATGARIRSPMLFRSGSQIKLSVDAARRCYVFNAWVTRLEVRDEQATMGLAFFGIPLELRRLRTRPPSLNCDQRMLEGQVYQPD